MKKIMILIPSFEGGGAERLAIDIANNFHKLEHEVMLFSDSKEGPYINELSPDVLLSFGPGKGMLKAVKAISKSIKYFKPDIIFCSQVHVGLAAYLSRFYARSQAKLFVREASTPSRKFSFIKNPFQFFLLKKMGKFVYENVDCVIAPNDSVKNDLLTFYSEKLKIETLINPFDVEKIKALSQDVVMDDWLIQNKIPVILSVGRLTDVKDFSLLLDAFSLLISEMKCYLIILGDGPLKAGLKKQVNDMNLDEFVKFSGFVKNPYPYMLRSNLYVLSSKYEGMPNALIQAAVLGTSSISTNCASGPSDILHNERLSPVGDCQMLLNNMRLFLYSNESGIKLNIDNLKIDKFCKKILMF